MLAHARVFSYAICRLHYIVLVSNINLLARFPLFSPADIKMEALTRDCQIFLNMYSDTRRYNTYRTSAIFFVIQNSVMRIDQNFFTINTAEIWQVASAPL